jgi:hypothetical protein
MPTSGCHCRHEHQIIVFEAGMPPSAQHRHLKPHAMAFKAGVLLSSREPGHCFQGRSAAFEVGMPSSAQHRRLEAQVMVFKTGVPY